MIEDALNSNKDKEPVKKDIIIEFDKKRTEYADMLKAILSICNQSDAADFNKKVHINRFDEIKVTDNKSQISEKIYEVLIGLPGEQGWCEEVTSYHGLHFCMLGKNAHIYVDETHTDQKAEKAFIEYANQINKDFEKLKKNRSQEGFCGCSIVFWKPSSEENKSFKTQFNEVACVRYVDFPKYIKKIAYGIAWPFRQLYRLMGFGRQTDILNLKYQTLIKDFYIHYLPMLIGELDAK